MSAGHQDTRDKPGWRSLAAVALVAALGWPGATQAHCKIQALELPVKIVGQSAIATVGINGTQVPLILDSGALFSFLTRAAAKQLNLDAVSRRYQVSGITGGLTVNTARVEHLTLWKTDLPNVQFAVGINEPGEGALGLLGRNILGSADTEYDLAHAMVRLVYPGDGCADIDLAYWAGEKPVSEVALLRNLEEKTPPIQAEIQLNGHTVSAVFDTGSPDTIMTLATAHLAGVRDRDMVAEPTPITGVGKGSAKSWSARFDTVQVGDETVRNNRLVVGDYQSDSEDMLVGIDFFLSHRIYVSQKRLKMLFTYNGGPVFASNRSEHIVAEESGRTAPLAASDYARRGMASHARGDLANALADLDRACAQAPDKADFFAARALVHLDLQDPAKALGDLDTALRLDPTLGDSRIERTALREANHQHELALQDLATLDATLPPQSDLRRVMADMYGKFTMPAQQLAQWNLWIPAHEGDIKAASAYNSRCWVRVELGIDLDKALDDCDDALDLGTTNASFLDSRAWLQLRRGKPGKAIDDFDRALALAAHQAWSLYGRGLAHLALGEAVAGQADLAAARRESPDIDASVKRSGLPTAPMP